MRQKDLVLVVTREWFEQIKSGRKTVDYREIKAYWTKKLGAGPFRNVIVQCGYPAKEEVSEMNTLVFPWTGYKITQVKAPQTIYDAVNKTLQIREGEYVYAIPLKKAECPGT